MLLPSQANVIADELVEQQRLMRVSEKNAAARRVPFLYGIPQLESLEPWERSELVFNSARRINSQWSAFFATLGWVALCLLAWYAFGLFDQPRNSLVALASVVVVPVYFIRAFFVRSDLRRQLASRSADRS